MDILRRELNAIYAAQRLEEEVLDPEAVAEAVRGLASLAQMTNGMAVITDAACDRCYMQAGAVGELLGLAHALPAEYGSSDEDLIYNRIHPEDLAEKRMLEYEYFKYADRLPPTVKTKAKATCRLRMRDRGGRYVYIDNSTGLMRLSPAGRIWLILCRYELSPDQTASEGISPRILHVGAGNILEPDLGARKRRILSAREKEILRLIGEGRPSKAIASALGISINTVSRHRQNILAKLSVSNAAQALSAARSMGLL